LCFVAIPGHIDIIQGKLLFGDQQEGEHYYEGDFQDGQMTGTGVQKFADGRVYEGTFSNGIMEGQGVMTTGDYEYTGSFKNNLKDGRGKLQWKSGDIYEGEFWKDFPHGKGKHVSGDGKKSYEGEWARKEKYMALNGNLPIYDKYPEPFVHSRRVGTIKEREVFEIFSKKDIWMKHEKGWSPMCDRKGEQLVGLVLRRGMQHGSGVLTEYERQPGDTSCKVISVYKGNFFEDKKCGEGSWRHVASGYIYEGRWDNDKPKVESWFLSLAVKGDVEASDEKVGDKDGTKGKSQSSIHASPKLSIITEPLLLTVEEEFEACVVPRNYDGECNLSESGRWFSVCAKMKSDETEENLVFAIEEDVVDASRKLKMDFIQSAIDMFDPENKTLSVVKGPVDVSSPVKLRLQKKPKPEPDDGKSKVVRRRKKTVAEKKERELSEIKLPAFEILRVPQSQGCAWIGAISFDEDTLPVGTDVHISVVDATEGLPERFKVSGGKQFGCVLKLVDEKIKSAARKGSMGMK